MRLLKHPFSGECRRIAKRYHLRGLSGKYFKIGHRTAHIEGRRTIPNIGQTKKENTVSRNNKTKNFTIWCPIKPKVINKNSDKAEHVKILSHFFIVIIKLSKEQKLCVKIISNSVLCLTGIGS